MKKHPVHLLFTFSLLLFISLNSCKTSGPDGDSTGVTDDEIVIGSWGPMTGPAALWGNVVKGIDSYFKLINDEGGIHGRKIKFIYKDDAYDPSKTVPAVRELVQRDEVFAVVGGIGTATNMAVKDFLSENGIPWITPMSGAAAFTHPPSDNIYSVFPLYYDEGTAMTRYALEELGATKIGIIYQNDDFGKSGLVASRHVLQQGGNDFVASLPAEVMDTDLSSHIARLKSAGAEVVLLWLLPRQAAISLGTAAVMDYKPKWIASMVLSDLALMHDITKGAWEGVIFNYPSRSLYNDENNQRLMQLRDAFQKYYPEDRWSTFSAAGALWTEILIEGLKNTGRDLTRESLLKAMSEMDSFTGTAGITVSFGENKHLGARAVYLMECISGSEVKVLGDIIESNVDISVLAKLH